MFELIENGDLCSYIANGGAFPEAVTRYYFKQIIGILEHLEFLKIANRDLKPDNILLDENFDLKLIDFGLATTKFEIT